MCAYCGQYINGHAVELQEKESLIRLCDEECAVLYHQEQQQRHFQSWVRIR